MAYLDQANLASDPEFNRRLSAALTDEGRSKVTDPVGKVIMNSPGQGVAWFMPFVASAPGFGGKYADGGQAAIGDLEILAAVQASWADVATVHDAAGTT